MRGLARVLGIVLMGFNGLAVVAMLFVSCSMISEIGIGMTLAVISIYVLFFLLGYLLRRWGMGGSAKKHALPPKDGVVQAASGVDWPAGVSQGAVQAASGAERGDALAGRTLYTVIAYYLDLPLHDGDNFFLFEKEEEAQKFIEISGRRDISVRELNKEIVQREIGEYLCSGYFGAVLKRDLSVISISDKDRKMSVEELIREFGLGNLGSVGNILPMTCKKMHNYANQISYSRRKYGDDLSGASESWRKHLDDFAGEVIRYLLCARMCLPADGDPKGKMTLSILTAVMPSGEKWAAVFTDAFAIRRYMRRAQQSIVLPGLVADVAKDIRSGKMQGIKGIMVNPGREEFKMTPEAIAKQEEWFRNHPDKRAEYEDGWSKFGVPQSAGEILQRADRIAGTAKEEAGAEHPHTDGFVQVGKLCAGACDEYIYYDPKYRRFVIDHYEEADGEKKYCGRETEFPQDIIDRLSGDARYPGSEKESVTDKILEIMAEKEGFG